MHDAVIRCLLLTLGLLASPGAVADDPRAAARGWLELDQAQRARRDLLAPLPLGSRRALDAVERRERLDLRALDQRQQRAAELARRRDEAIGRPGAPAGAVGPAAADARISGAARVDRQRRQREALRLDRQRRSPTFGPTDAPATPRARDGAPFGQCRGRC